MSEELGPCPVCEAVGSRAPFMARGVSRCHTCGLTMTDEQWNRLSRAARLARAVEALGARGARLHAWHMERGWDAQLGADGRGWQASAPTLADALCRLADEVTP